VRPVLIFSLRILSFHFARFSYPLALSSAVLSLPRVVQGTDSTILCDWPSRAVPGSSSVVAALPRAHAAAAVRRDFEARHRQQFGFLMADKPLVVQSVSAEAWAAAGHVDEPLRATAPRRDPATGACPPDRPGGQPRPLGTPVACYMEGAMQTTPVYGRPSLCPGDEVKRRKKGQNPLARLSAAAQLSLPCLFFKKKWGRKREARRTCRTDPSHRVCASLVAPRSRGRASSWRRRGLRW
jgi:hypothetical protein